MAEIDIVAVSHSNCKWECVYAYSAYTVQNVVHLQWLQWREFVFTYSAYSMGNIFRATVIFVVRWLKNVTADAVVQSCESKSVCYRLINYMRNKHAAILLLGIQGRF